MSYVLGADEIHLQCGGTFRAELAMKHQDDLLAIAELTAPARNRQIVSIQVHALCGGKQQLIEAVHRLDVDSAGDMSSLELVVESAVKNVKPLHPFLVLTLNQAVKLRISMIAI